MKYTQSWMKPLILIFIIISVNHAISQEVLTNKSVYDLVEVGFQSDIIIAKINSSECDFDTTVEGLKQLKSKKVPNEVILAMIDNKKKKKKLDALTEDKGQLDGDPYAPSYFGGSGPGKGGVGYGLNGRGRPSRQIFKQDCNEYGLVVVKIEVDPSGRVVSAEPGVRGTTNTHPCLFEPAKKIALSHKWPADSKAPTRQIGFVSINFDISQ